jgi:hypothetical protein
MVQCKGKDLSITTGASQTRNHGFCDTPQRISTRKVGFRREIAFVTLY